MAFKSSLDPENRGFYFASSGNDEEDGKTLERPKKTVQEAIDATGNLIPVPDLANQAQVSAAQGGLFNEGFVLPGFVNFDATNAIFNAGQAVSITMGDASNCRITGVRNSQNNSTCFLHDGNFLSGSNSLFCFVGGDDSIGYEIKGVSEGIFSTCDRLTLEGDRSIGIKITGTFSDPIDIDCDVVLLTGTDSVYVDFNPDNALDACVINVSSVFSSDANVLSRGTSTSTGYIARSGHLTINSSMLVTRTFVIVKSGAVVDVRQETVIGEIIVELGGVLNINVLTHVDGAITNNGVINGIIGGQYFGTYQQKPVQESILLAESFITQSPTGLNAPLQLKFGPAQLGPSDPVQIDALGNVRINQSDQYMISITLQYGRVGAGSFSLLFFRVKIDGVQAGRSHSAKMDNANSNFPVEFSIPSNMISGQIMTVEIWRDSSGFDAGSLFPEVPTLAGASSTPSAAIRMTRNRLTTVPQVIVFDYTVLLNEKGIQTNAAGFVTGWNNSGDSQFDLTTVIGSVTSLVLHQPGTALFYGAINDYISTPNSAANRITGNIDIRVLGVTAVNWAPLVNETLVSKFEIVGEFAYLFRIGAGGNLEVLLSDNGTDSLLGSSTVPTGFINGTKHGVRITWRNLTNITEFFTSEDGVVWNKLGNDVLQPGSGIFDSDSSVEIGSREGGTQERFRGTLERVEIFRGIDGILEVNFDALNGGYSTGKTADMFMSPITGETYTMHGDTFIQNSGVPIINSIGGAALTSGAGITITVPMTVFFIAKTHQLTGVPQFFTAGLSNSGENPTTEITTGNEFIFSGGVSRLTAGPADTNLRLHIIRYNGDATSSYEVDGVGFTTGDAGAEDWDYATILAELSGIFTMLGSFGELIVYNRGLTNVEVGIVKAALKAKWDGLN